MPKKSNYPEGKKKTIKVDINSDFENEMKSAINKERKKYWLLKDETESQYIKRIQEMHAENCENEALGKNKKE